ncbi:hypothetical protein AALO_G00232870 [Alosa alosa]|uniref:Interferon-induced transmembrane protein n=1 Tax=Alosa alosa TaxID=278164 RepID=A0AAV6FUJ1_9TELE|nr:hypothetical protein AALO_G00232870 [Alosa alosa]
MSTPSNEEPSYMGWSIFTTICCCLPLGIAAIYKSNQVTAANAGGDMEKARHSSRAARNFNIAGLIFGLICLIYIIQKIANS